MTRAGVYSPFLWANVWSTDGSFDRRRWPRPQAATVVVEEEENVQFKSSLPDLKRSALEMQWVVVANANGGFCLRVAWNPLRQDGLLN